MRPHDPTAATDRDAVDDPHRLASCYLAAVCGQGPLIIRHWRGEWHRWHGGAYRTVSDGDMRADITDHIREEFILAGEMEPEDDDKGPRSTRKVSTRLVGDTLNALAGMTHVGDAIDAPAWIDGETGPDPAGLIVTRSGILDVAAWTDGRPDCVLKLTPALWTPTALPFAFAAHAPTPKRWLAFLGQLWPDDPDSIACLQEWMGYLLTADTRQQKMLFLLGPKRAGKGTIARIIRELVGPLNVAGPTLGTLATNFGLSGLLGKTVAIISDARLSGRTDSAVVVERLLAISGEDAIGVDRKFRDAIAVKLPTRFVIISNELPRLGDASGALAGRLILLRFTRSFFGGEDTGLTDALLAELPGILLWALQGLKRLRARGRLMQPESGAEMVAEMEDLGSPVGAFVREKCVIEPEASVPTPELYAAYRAWCEAHGRKEVTTAEGFGRDLRAAVPQLDKKRRRQGSERWWDYTPIRLRRFDEADPADDELGHQGHRGHGGYAFNALRFPESDSAEKEVENHSDLYDPRDPWQGQRLPD
ncbi:MAG: NTP-binding protein [Planctomycetia bacterium]|nr:NTP-binding protein [Planctomycetia bacterium]